MAKGDNQTIAAALPNARITVLDGNSTSPSTSSPEVFAENVVAFLRDEVRSTQ